MKTQLKDRIQKLAKSFTKKNAQPKCQRQKIRDQVGAGFNQIRSEIGALESFSQKIAFSISARKLKITTQQALSQDHKSPAQTIDSRGKNRRSKLGAVRATPTQVYPFQTMSGNIIDAKALFITLPFPSSFVVQLDCTMKQRSAVYLPLSKSDGIYKQLRDLSENKEGHQKKNQFQYRVHLMTFQQYADLISYDVYPATVYPKRAIQFQDKQHIVIRSNEEYAQLLKQYRSFQKYFFEGKDSKGTQLLLGQLVTEECAAFDNLYKNIQLSLQVCRNCESKVELQKVYVHAYKNLQIRLQDLIVQMATFYCIGKQFHQIYRSIHFFKKLLLDNQFENLRQLQNQMRKNKQQSFGWYFDIKGFLFGLKKAQIFDTVLQCFKYLRSKSQNTKKITYKEMMRVKIQLRK